MEITKNIDDSKREITKEITPENYPELEKLKSKILEIFKSEIQNLVETHTIENRARWNIETIIKTMRNIVPLNQKADKVLKEIIESDRDDKLVKDEITGYLFGETVEAYEEREKEMGYGVTRQIEKAALLRNIDLLWMEHLDEMQMLRDGIGLRGYGQLDPLIEYKKESYKMFQALLKAIDEGVFTTIFKIKIMKQSQSSVAPAKPVTPVKNKNILPSEENKVAGSVISNAKKNKVGRNDPCPCGSGKKYKKCCGRE